MQVDLDSITIAFGNADVLSDFAATFRTNAITALAGPSGSGKTSILAAVAGDHRPAGGRIRFTVDGVEVAADRRHIAWVTQQNAYLASRSVLANVIVGALASGTPRRRAEALAHQALADVGLPTFAERPAHTLSGGERQRVGIARALASQRPIILADEPTSSLDAGNTAIVADLFSHIRDRATIIVATHDPQMIDACEYVVTTRPRTHAA